MRRARRVRSVMDGAGFRGPDEAASQGLDVDDAMRAHQPGEVLLSALSGERSGFTRRDFVASAEEIVEPEANGATRFVSSG